MSNYSDSYINDRLKQMNDDIAVDLLPAMVFVGLLMVLGVVGNLVVCFVFGFRLRIDTQSILILSLAVIDLFNCLISMPYEILNMHYFYTFKSELACRFLKFICTFSALSSILILMIIAVDRYCKVCRPLKRQMVLAEAKKAVVIALLFSLIASFPSIALYGIWRIETDDPEVRGYHCFISESLEGSKLPIALNILMLLAFFIALIALSFIYLRIWSYMNLHKKTSRARFSASCSLTSTCNPEITPRGSLIANSPERHQRGLSTGGGKHLKDKVLTEQVSLKDKVLTEQVSLKNKVLTEQVIAAETCSAANRDISKPSAPSPLAVSEDNKDKDNKDRDYISLLEDEELVNIVLLLTSNSNNQASGQNTGQNAHTAPVTPPSTLRETADVCAAIWPSSAKPIQVEVSSDSSKRLVDEVRRVKSRSAVSEICIYKTTVIAMSVTVVFFLSFLPHLCLTLMKLLMGSFERHLKGPALFWFNTFLRSYLINSVSNPIIYGVQNYRFRAEFLKLLRQFLNCRKQL